MIAILTRAAAYSHSQLILAAAVVSICRKFFSMLNECRRIHPSMCRALHCGRHSMRSGRENSDGARRFALKPPNLHPDFGLIEAGPERIRLFSESDARIANQIEHSESYRNCAIRPAGQGFSFKVKPIEALELFRPQTAQQSQTLKPYCGTALTMKKFCHKPYR